MTKATVDDKRSLRGSANDRRWDRAEMKKPLRLTSYANRPPHTTVLQDDKGIRKGNQTVKITD